MLDSIDSVESLVLEHRSRVVGQVRVVGVAELMWRLVLERFFELVVRRRGRRDRGHAVVGDPVSLAVLVPRLVQVLDARTRRSAADLRVLVRLV